MNQLTQRADIATRFPKGVSPNPGGRPSIAWLREKVEVVDPDTGQTKLQDMADHLIEVATKWEIVRRGEEIPVASARDSVEACRLLWQALSILRKTPPSEEEQVMKLAEHLRGAAKDAAEMAIKVLGTRMYSMSPVELGAFLREAGGNPAGFLEAAKEIMDNRDRATAVEAQVEGEGQELYQSVSLPPEPVSEPSAPVLPDSAEGWPKP